MKKFIFLPLLLLGSLACVTLETSGRREEISTATPVPVIPTGVPATDAAPTSIARRENVDVYCSSNVPEALEAYNQGFQFESAGDIQSAMASYRKAIELDPAYCDAMDNLALLLRQIGEDEEAISLYQASIAVAPGNLVSHQGLANAYYDLEQYDKALEEYNALIGIDPAYPEGYYGAGRIHFLRENYREAIANFKTAEQLYQAEGSPYIVDAQLYLGLSHTLLAEYEAGRDYLELIYPQMQDKGYVNYYLGICYYYGETIRNEALAKQYLIRARELGVELEPELETFVNSP